MPDIPKSQNILDCTLRLFIQSKVYFKNPKKVFWRFQRNDQNNEFYFDLSNDVLKFARCLPTYLQAKAVSQVVALFISNLSLSLSLS